MNRSVPTQESIQQKGRREGQVMGRRGRREANNLESRDGPEIAKEENKTHKMVNEENSTRAIKGNGTRTTMKSASSTKDQSKGALTLLAAARSSSTERQVTADFTASGQRAKKGGRWRSR